MSNFNNLKHYILPSDLLLSMLEAYKNIGKTDIYLDQIVDIKDKLASDSLNEDTFYLADLLNIDVKDQRKQLILFKDSAPRNQQEEQLLNIKRTLNLIRSDASKYRLNAAELIGYVNHIYGKNKFGYTTKSLTAFENKKPIRKSIRMLINECFDEYDDYISLKKYESIILSITLYLDIVNLEPYNGMNGLASILGLYYLLLQNKVAIFNYLSFFKLLHKNYNKFLEETKNASINYTEGFFTSSNLSRLIFDIIIETYKELSEFNHHWKYQNKGLKSDNVETTIYKLPEFFTKDDIRRANPNVSDATINRILNKLRDDGVIMPLGTGRSAKWRKNPESEIPISRYFGD